MNATFDGVAIGPINTLGSVTFDGGGGNDTLVGPDADTTWTVSGTNAGTLGGPISFAFANVENLTGGGGTDTFAFTPAGSVAGMIDGGGGTNTLDYSAFTTPVHTNLGINILAGASWSTVSNLSEYYEHDYYDTGSASLTYHAATGTFDLTVSTWQRGTNTLQPMSLVGPGGQMIMDLLALPTAHYTFTIGLYQAGILSYTATAVPLPAAYEAALFNNQLAIGYGSQTAYNYLTSRLGSGTPTASSTGTATGTGGVANIANVTGGASDDGIIGSFADNVLLGGDGNNIIFSGPGNDTLVGGAGNDTLISGAGASTLIGGAGNDTLNSGLGVNTLDGGAGNDTFFCQAGNGTVTIDGGTGNDVASLGGPTGTAPVLVEPGAGGGLAVRPTDLDPLTYDVKGVETVGVGGSGVVTVDNLAGVSDLTTLAVSGNTMNVTPSPNVTVNVNNGMPPYWWLVSNSGTLNVNTAGATVSALQASLSYAYGLLGPDYSVRPSVQGSYSFADRQPVNFQNVGFVTPVISDPSVVTTAVGIR